MTTVARLEQMIGQEATRDRLRITLRGALARGTQVPHVLLSGPPGHGKTTLARIVAAELGEELVVSSGPSLGRVADLAGVLLGCEPSSVLLIDEIHRLPAPVEEALYEALQTGTISVIVGAKASARALTLEIPAGLIVVGATTKPGAMSAPLRDRFGLYLALTPYTDAEIARIVAAAWERVGPPVETEAAAIVALAAKGVPRVALHLADRVADVAALGGWEITASVARQALELFGFTAQGLDETDRVLLGALTGDFAGRAVGLDALAQAINVDKATVEAQYEGPLVRSGLIVRTPQGRMATPAAYVAMNRQPS